jgi:hypothetical protein
MARDYGRLLMLAEELQFFTGYLGSEELNQRNQMQAQFDAERRKLAYALLKEGPDHHGVAASVAASVAADMDRLAATSADYTPAAIAEAREGLLAEIDHLARSSPAMRFLLRWGPVALGLVVAGVYIYLRTRQ